MCLHRGDVDSPQRQECGILPLMSRRAWPADVSPVPPRTDLCTVLVTLLPPHVGVAATAAPRGEIRANTRRKRDDNMRAGAVEHRRAGSCLPGPPGSSLWPRSHEPSRQARALVVRGCFNCHSNFTTWPWYSNVAPVSWLIQRDVVGGRQALNFSTWNTPQANAGDAASAVQDGAMPPSYYALLHPRATFSPVEMTALIRALATLSGPTGDQARPPLGAVVRVATPGGATPSGR